MLCPLCKYQISYDSRDIDKPKNECIEPWVWNKDFIEKLTCIHKKGNFHHWMVLNNHTTGLVTGKGWYKNHFIAGDDKNGNKIHILVILNMNYNSSEPIDSDINRNKMTCEYNKMILQKEIDYEMKDDDYDEEYEMKDEREDSNEFMQILCNIISELSL
jgi:hypothetical protein